MTKRKTLTLTGECAFCGATTCLFTRTGGKTADVVELTPPRCAKCLAYFGAGPATRTADGHVFVDLSDGLLSPHRAARAGL